MKSKYCISVPNQSKNNKNKATDKDRVSRSVQTKGGQEWECELGMSWNPKA